MKNPNLSAFLSADPGVAAIAGDRIYPDMIPMATQGGTQRVPCVVYSRSSVEYDHLFAYTSSLARVTMQVDCYAAVYDDAESLASAVEAALLGFAGAMGPVNVDTILPETESVPGPDPEPGLFRVYLSFNIWCREA